MDAMNGKSFLIAGGTGGLGQEIVVDLSYYNCSMMIVHREQDKKWERLRGRLEKGKAHVSWYQCDFNNSDEINDAVDIFFDQEKDAYGMINLLGDPARVDWQKAQISHMQDSFLRNASAPLHSAKQFAARLRQFSRPGAIVLFSSMQGLYPFEGSLYYGVAKAALAHGVKILAKDFGGEPFIRINAIAPGVNEAGMAEESIRKGKYEKFLDQKIIPRYGQAADIAKLAIFLLDDNLYMSGQTILYDGGLSLRRDLLR